MAEFVTVGSSGAFQLEAPANYSLRITHEGGQTVYYSTSPRVSSTINDGTLVTGGQFTYTGKRFFITQAGTGTQGSSASLRLDNVPVVGENLTSHWFYNVRDYGVILDGTTDDTVNAQALLTTIRLAGGGTFYIPNGTLRTTADLAVGSNTRVLGESRASVIRRDSTSATVNVITNYNATENGGDTDITVENVTVYRQGEATVPGSAYDNTIHLVGVTRADVRQCRVRGSAKAVHMEGCQQFAVTDNYVDTYVDNAIACNALGAKIAANGIVARNIISTPTASGFSGGSSSVLNTQSYMLIEGNQFTDCASNAVECGTNDASNRAFVKVRGNVARYTGSGTINNSILLTALNDSVVEANTVESGNIHFDYLDASIFNQRCSMIGNTVKGSGTDTSGITMKNVKTGAISANTVYGKFLAVQGCWDILADGNQVSGAGSRGFYISTGSVANARIRLANNTAFNNNQLAGAGDAGAGFMLDGGDKISLINNRAYDDGTGTQKYGLYINATTNVLDINNDFTGNATGERATSTGSPTYAGMHTWSSSGDVAVNGYVTVVINGTSRKLATIA